MRWFIADTHFGADWVDNYVSAINNAVGRRDTLFVLGDYGDLRVRHKITCKDVWLILGNHDCETQAVAAFGRARVRETYMLAMRNVPIQDNWTLHPSELRRQKQVAELGVGDSTRMTIRMWLSHYPHIFWPSSHHGTLHAYGHMHGEYEACIEQALGMDRRSTDVGAMCTHMGGRPIADFEITSLLMKRKGHHAPTTQL